LLDPIVGEAVTGAPFPVFMRWDGGLVILSAAKLGSALALATLVVAPAQADVLEIGNGGQARWVAGPGSAAAAPAIAAEVQGDAALVADQAAGVPPGQAQLVPGAYAAKVAELAARYDLSPALIEAVVWQESRWHAAAVSPVGARGLAQLMPGTARELGVNPDDPLANLEGGARYLRAQLDRFGGDVEKALAAYNAGPGRVESAGGIPAIRETQNYVASVMGRLSDNVRSSK
jgi:soluble lytic murein transglycosylase-like protein